MSTGSALTKGPNPPLALTAACIAFFQIAINTTAINSAINDIANDLDMMTTTLSWAVNMYVLAAAALVALAGRLGDEIGVQRVFYVGYAAFVLGSVANALAPNAEIMIGARAFQGIAAALLVTGATAALGATAPPNRKGLYVGIWGAVGSLGLAMGPLFGGILTETLDWRIIFWAELFVIGAGIATAVVGLRNIPIARGGRLDPVGGAVLAVGLLMIVAAAQGGYGWGFGSPLFLGLLGVGVALLILFGEIERRREPDRRLLDIRLFRVPAFSGSLFVSFAAFGGVFGVLYFFNLYSQSVVVLDYSAIVASLALLPFGVTLFLFSLVAGPMADRVGFRLPLAIGMVVAALGFFLLSDISTGAGNVSIWVPLALVGIGIGSTFAISGAAGLAAVPERFIGEASGIINTIRYVGGAVVLAIGSAIYLSSATSAFNRRLQSEGEPAADQSDLDAALTGSNSGLASTLDALPTSDADLVSRAAEVAITDGFRAASALMGGLCVLAAITSAFLFIPRREIEESPAAALGLAEEEIAKDVAEDVGRRRP